MNNDNFQILDRSLDIHQSYLLEASAGTGKTFSIEHLVVRFLIEQDSIALAEILIVSFTKAATSELKNRIRNNITQTIQHLSNHEKQSPDYVQAVIEKGEDAVRVAKKRLNEALLSYDDAQVFTIHAFCKNMLTENVCGLEEVFTSKEQASSVDILRVIHDFFRIDIRENRYSPAQIEQVLAYFRNDLIELEKTLGRVINHGSEIVPGETFSKSFHLFTQSMKKNFSKYSSEGIQNDFYQQAPHFKGLCNRKKEIKKEVVQSIEQFSLLFDQSEWTGDDFDFLIRNGIPYLKYLDPSKKSVRGENGEPMPLHYPSFAEELKAFLGEIVETARSQIAIFSTMAYDCQCRMKAFLEEEEKFRFDDLLLNMWRSLENKAFIKNIRQRYRVAIIDEFQDTDPIQWMIFKTIFLNHTHLYLVGDPKQSIYAFRQADIYTYLDAVETFGEKKTKTLGVNFRSEPTLIHALNTLFSSKHIDGLLQLPKIQKYIPYNAVEASISTDQKKHNDQRGSVHFFICEGEQGRGKRWPTIALENEYLFPSIIDEILRMKNQNEAELSQWTILVKDRYQAMNFVQFCKSQNVPVVTQWQRNIADSPVIESMKKLLAAVFHPKDFNAMKQLLLDRICGWKIHDIQEIDEGQVVQLRYKINQLKQLIEEVGFAPFYLSFLDSIWKGNEKTVEEMLLSGEEGIEYYQDLQHLATLMIEDQKVLNSPEQYALYLEEFRELKSANSDRYSVREDLSEEAIKVMTIHMSKGLEFDYVVALGVTKRSSMHRNHSQVDFVNCEENHQRKMKAISEKNQKEYAEFCAELDAEKMRQLYVTFTRAKYRLYVPIAIQKDLNRSLRLGEPSPVELYLGNVLARISHRYCSIFEQSVALDCSKDSEEKVCKPCQGGLFEQDDVTDAQICPVSYEKSGLASSDSAHQIIQDINIDSVCDWLDSCDHANSITYDRIQEPKKVAQSISHRISSEGGQDVASDCPDLPRVYEKYGLKQPSIFQVPGKWKTVHSFSSLSKAHETNRQPPHDYQNPIKTPSTLPSGSDTGILIHKILERISFNRIHEVDLDEQIAQVVHKTKMEPWKDVIKEIILSTLSTPIELDGEPFSISDVSPTKMYKEIEFLFPYHEIGLKTIYRSEKELDLHADYLRGVIDLVFGHRGKYYIVDWKTNWLGPTDEYYESGSLQQSMEENDYFLQADIYREALRRYLKRIDKRPFDECFGGTLYIYVRGTKQDIPNAGIYFHKALKSSVIP